MTEVIDYRAAYVPEVEGRDWEEAAELAVEWVDRECDERGAVGLLVTETVSGGDSTPSLTRFRRRHGDHATPKSRTAWRHERRRPVLVYVPMPKLLAFATGYARHAALCAVESTMFRLDGWAAAAEAIDLTTGNPTPPLSEEVTDVLAQLHFNGNNAWADSWGKSRAGHLLDDLDKLLSPEQNTADFITGWMIANGSNDRAAENLHKIVAGRRKSRGGRRR